MMNVRSRICQALNIVTLCATLNTACAIEMIDALIAERGVTECTSSSGSEDSDTTDGESSAGSTSESSSSTSTTESDASTSSGESTTTEAETGGSSTGHMPLCGNGVIEGDETCDDGNEIPGDGCQECAKDSIVFVSSVYYQGFALGGLYGADQRCRNLAGNAGLPNPLTFKAWLSSSTISAHERLLHSNGRYLLVNGLVVAQNWTALTSGMLENPLIVDENSQTKDDPVWTGTLALGEAAPGTKFCNDWEESGSLEFSGVGNSSSFDSTWSYFDNGPCAAEARLYCIEQ